MGLLLRLDLQLETRGSSTTIVSLAVLPTHRHLRVLRRRLGALFPESVRSLRLFSRISRPMASHKNAERLSYDWQRLQLSRDWTGRSALGGPWLSSMEEALQTLPHTSDMRLAVGIQSTIGRVKVHLLVFRLRQGLNVNIPFVHCRRDLAPRLLFLRAPKVWVGRWGRRWLESTQKQPQVNHLAPTFCLDKLLDVSGVPYSVAPLR